jgi:hypothetical protein
LSDAQSSPASSLLVFTEQSRWLHVAGLVVLLGTGMFLTQWVRPLPTRRTAGAPHVFLLPLSELTPGAMRPLSVGELCGGKKEQPARIPASLLEQVFRSYGADLQRAEDYELDYLITPELGGAADAHNLWPQAYSNTAWNAFVKDELERSLHRDVCEGRTELAAAQGQIARNWIAAYKQRFKTDKPLRDYEANPLTHVDRELILSELEELGVNPPAFHADGSRLLAFFQAARAGSISDGRW